MKYTVTRRWLVDADGPTQAIDAAAPGLNHETDVQAVDPKDPILCQQLGHDWDDHPRAPLATCLRCGTIKERGPSGTYVYSYEVPSS